MLEVVGSIALAALTYCADVVTVSKGVTTHSHVCSDGIRTRSEALDEKGQKSGSFRDEGKKLFWVY
jgi:hypothetical protein